MYRTTEEEREYQNLDSQRKERYDLEAKQDPSLTHKQIMQMIKFLPDLYKEMFEYGDDDPKRTLKRPPVRKKLLEQLGDWLRDNAQSVWREVKYQITSAIEYLGDLISRGVDWVDENIIEPIGDFFRGLFD